MTRDMIYYLGNWPLASLKLTLLAIIAKYEFPIRIALYCIKHCWGVYEQNSIVNSVHVDDWTVELAIIASNDTGT